MCSYSAIIDTWRQDWQPYIQPGIQPFAPHPNVPVDATPILDKVERNKLKKEIAEFRALLEKARKWDKEHSTDPCVETPQKIEALMEIVRALGLEEEVEIVLKETEEDDDNADTHDWVAPATGILRGGGTSGRPYTGNITVDGSTIT